MKRCAFCGAEIPDNEWLCSACKEGPAARGSGTQPNPSGTPVQQPAAARPVAVAQPQTQAAKDTTKKDKKKVPKPGALRRTRNVLIVCLVIALLIAAGAITYIVRNYSVQQKETARLRVYENDLKVREAEAAEMEAQVEAAQAQIAALQAEREDLNSQLSDLYTQLNGTESAMSQSIYDQTTQQMEIENLNTLLDENELAIEELEIHINELEESKAQLEEDIATLQENLDTAAEEKDQLQEDYDTLQEDYDQLEEDSDKLQKDYDKLQADYDELEAENRANASKANFMDRYIVFIEDNGTNYYHTFDCSEFTATNFWVYNRSLARSSGYTPCPICGGGG